MKSKCKTCPHAVATILSENCRDCGFPFSAKEVLAHYVGRLKRPFTRSPLTVCPTCERPTPLTATICPHCDSILSSSDAARVLFSGASASCRKFLSKTSPGRKRKVQRLYLLLSVCATSAAFQYGVTMEEESSSPQAFLTVVYLSLLLVLIRWFIPRELLIVIAKRTTGTVKLGLVFNYLSALLLLQQLFVGFKRQALGIALLFLVTWLSAWIACRFLWPISLEIHTLLFGEGESSDFNPTDRQSRKARRN